MITIIISFFLDNICSNFITLNSLFYPLFSILSLVLVYPYFNKNTSDYLIIAFTLGLSYDLVYTDTIFVNAFIFLILAYILRKVFSKITYNYLSVLLVSIITIIYYRAVTYVVLIIIDYLDFNILSFLKSVYSSIFINIIYLSIFYVILNKRLIFKKLWHINY